MTHLCHAHGCRRSVPPSMFMCKPHWYSLPEPTRNAIWREYRRGQEVDKNPSLRYLAVHKLAVAQVAFKPNDTEAAKLSAQYVAQAIQYRAKCIVDGLGDPLEGLVP